jgi:hypothetical protein
LPRPLYSSVLPVAVLTDLDAPGPFIGMGLLLFSGDAGLFAMTAGGAGLLLTIAGVTGALGPGVGAG